MTLKRQIVLLLVAASAEMYLIGKGENLAAMWGVGGYTIIRALWLNHQDREERERNLNRWREEGGEDEMV